MKFLVTLPVFVFISFCSAECPIECFCDRVTTCTGNNLLTQFPKINTSPSSRTYSPPMPSTMSIVRIELHDFQVAHLSGPDFLEIIGNITEISISRNLLQTFDNATFLSDTPYDSSNQTSFLPLRILDLSQNQLEYFVGGGKLAKVKILDLSGNKLREINELSGLKNLESINLRDNRIEYLSANIFQGLRNLQYISLDSNLLRALDSSTFSNLQALAHLILSSNPISNLASGFNWNSRVQFVDVSNVSLTTIPSSLTRSIRDFRCNNNNLSVIRRTDFESYLNVGLLVLDENVIESVEDNAFGRLVFLSRLWMNGNRLQAVPKPLPPSLRSLQLESNRIFNLTSSDFYNLNRLEELNLHSNQIASLPPNVFSGLTSLKTLDLRSNLIDVIYRDSFANLNKLETLDISQNPLKVIVADAFDSLRKVYNLHLSRILDSVEFEVTTFQPFHKLQVLELDDSPLLTQKLFQDQAFSLFPYLLELNIQRCDLEDLNLISSEIADINFHSVKMNGNMWDCEDLHGSAVFEIISKRVLVDGPFCATPQHLKNTPIQSLTVPTVSSVVNVTKVEKVKTTSAPVPEFRSSEEADESDESAGFDRSEEPARNERTEKTIVGFPFVVPSHDRNNNRNISPNNPQYAYLKFAQNPGVQRRTEMSHHVNIYRDDSNHMAIIFKTIIISALTCVGSIFSLMCIGFLIFRYSSKNSGSTISCSKSCTPNEGERVQRKGDAMVYTKYGNMRSNCDGSISTTNLFESDEHDHLPDSRSTVQNGITNDLYFIA